MSKKNGNSTPVSLSTNGDVVEVREMLVDKREPLDIVEKLRQKGINVKLEYLSSGDYIFSNIGIERKTLTDFWGSITARDKRIWSQMFELKRNFERPFLVIEKFDFSYLRSPEYSRQVWGTISSIALLGINVITIVGKSGGSPEFIDFLTYLYFSSDKTKKGSKPLPKKSEKPEDIYLDAICMIPGIGPVTAKKIVAHYKNFEELCTAKKEELVPLTGKSRVELLWRILHGDKI